MCIYVVGDESKRAAAVNVYLVVGVIVDDE